MMIMKKLEDIHNWLIEGNSNLGLWRNHFWSCFISEKKVKKLETWKWNLILEKETNGAILC